MTRDANPRLRVLCIHNSYQQFGGEDSVFSNESKLLEAAGHVVERLCVTNDEIAGLAARIGAAVSATYSFTGRRLVRAAIADFAPDIVHVHNFFPKLSPSIFDACIAARVPAVWTLHNFRIACANGLLFRDGKVCEDCVGHAPLPAIAHGCYRQSRVGSAAVAGMIAFHALRETWHHKVSRFIVLSEFAREKFVQCGLPNDRIAIKPNFCYPSAATPGGGGERHGALFVGRLSAEKGVATLVRAWADVAVPLTIIGDGPERAALAAAAQPHVTFAGAASRDAVAAAMAGAQALIVPSVWYENFPMTVVEAMASGTPIIASQIGALAHIVENGVTGLHFAAGDADDLARVATAAFLQADDLARMGDRARKTFAENFSPEANLRQLEHIYYDAIDGGKSAAA